jgi:hypothetical protein
MMQNMKVATPIILVRRGSLAEWVENHRYLLLAGACARLGLEVFICGEI